MRSNAMLVAAALALGAEFANAEEAFRRTVNGTVFKGVLAHNAVALAPTNGLCRFRRLDERATAAMPAAKQSRAYVTTGVELRFRVRKGEVKLIMGRLKDGDPVVCRVYHGDAIVDWPGTTRVIAATNAVWSFQAAAEPRLRARADRFGCRYDPEVIRVVLPPSDNLGIRDVVGEAEPPGPEMLPRTTYLAYGSSITHGSDAIATECCYASLVGDALGADVRNLGLAGSARMENEIADFIAGERFDYATLEMGVNVIGSMSAEEYERRVRYMIRRVAESHPKARILAIDVFRAELSGKDLERARDYRKALARVVRELGLPNVAHVNGLDALPEKDSLSTGDVHPSQKGHEAIARHLVGRFRGMSFR